MRGEQLPSVVIDREVIETAARRAGQIDHRDLSHGFPGTRRWLGDHALCGWQRQKDDRDDHDTRRGTSEHVDYHRVALLRDVMIAPDV